MSQYDGPLYKDDSDSGEMNSPIAALAKKTEQIPLAVDVESQNMPAETKRPSKIAIWIAVNIIATISIVCRGHHDSINGPLIWTAGLHQQAHLQ